MYDGVWCTQKGCGVHEGVKCTLGCVYTGDVEYIRVCGIHKLV